MLNLSPAPEKIPVPEISPAELEHGSSLWHDAWCRLRKNVLAVVGAGFVILLSLCSLLLPALMDLHYEVQGLDITAQPPGTKAVRVYSVNNLKRPLETTEVAQLDTDKWMGATEEAVAAIKAVGAGRETRFGDKVYRPVRLWLGSDTLGRDLLARILYGCRISLGVGLAATFVSLSIGVLYGAIAGYVGGKTDAAMMRFVDILYALPFTVFVILLTVYFGRNIILLFVAIGAVEWLTMARIVRGQVLSLKRMEFIEAARAMGLGNRRIIFRHMIPNVLGPIIVYTTLTIPAVMLLESFLSFLGLGVQPPQSSLGVLIKDGAERMEEFWWLLILPGAAFSMTLFSLNFFGDGLRDALDVRASKD